VAVVWGLLVGLVTYFILHVVGRLTGEDEEL
jgi:hypothetical protein